MLNIGRRQGHNTHVSLKEQSWDSLPQKDAPKGLHGKRFVGIQLGFALLNGCHRLLI